MNKLDLDYQNLLKNILENGVNKETRNGGTISVFGRQIRHKMSEGFPLLTTKKMAWKTMVTELLWFLRGDTNIKFLVDNNCHIWDGDAYKDYLKWVGVNNNPLNIKEFIDKIKTDSDFAGVYGDLGPIYGKQWRNWGEWATIDVPKKVLKPGIDQIQNLINDLKTNPDSRRLLVSAWNPADLDSCVLPPCHYGFQVYTRELNEIERGILYSKRMEGYVDTDDVKTTEHYDSMNIPKRAISLMWNQRSCDFPLGIPMNVSSYALLLMMIAKQVNMVPDELIGNLGDCHIYLNQIDGIKEQLTREPYELPTVKLSDRVVNDISEYTLDDITLENYQSHPSIKMPLSN
jgi:thymidylate synthase